MNYCDRIQYTVFTTPDAGVDEMVNHLLLKLPTDQLILRLVFFTAHTSNEEYVEQRTYLQSRIADMCGDRMPVVSLVSQPVLGAGMAMEVHSYIPGNKDKVCYSVWKGFPYITIENEEMKALFAGGIQGDVLKESIACQSHAVFGLLGEILEHEQIPLTSIIRQWNYIERITHIGQEGQHYQLFNNARSSFYQTGNWTNGYPAATGIGAEFGGILVDVDAVVFHAEDCFATPIDNKLQVAAHAYSERVLECGGKIKTTPKFERAKSMTFGNRKLVYISGTAAIRGEETLEGVDLKTQLHATLENIAELISGTTIRLLRVYLKDASFYREARSLLNEYDGTIPVCYLHTDVCRDSLLIEIEGIAKN